MIARYLLGIDLGTSSVKAALFEAADGRLLSQGAASYSVQQPQPGFAEQYPGDWWAGLLQAVKDVMSHAAADKMAGIGLSGQMHGLVCLDKNQQALQPAIIWADGRSVAELKALRDLQNNVSATMPGPPAAGFAAASALWLHRQQPQILQQTRMILCPKDYVALRLTGNAGTDASDASATWLFDVVQGAWAAEVIEFCGLNMAQMPAVGGSSAVRGHLTDEAASALGLAAGIPVVGGSADLAAQALGHGILDSDDWLVTVGTGGQVIRPVRQPAPDQDGRYYVFQHALPHTYYAQAAILSAGLSLRWLSETLGFAGRADAFAQLSNLAEQVPPGAEGLIFLPYLAGERSPLMDAQAAGLFLGLGLHHGPGHLARAVMEGVGFALKECMALLGDGDSPVTLSGGAAQSAVWPDILAAIWGRALLISEDDLPRACWGAAILAGVGVGLYRDEREGTAVRQERMRLIEPRPHAIYQSHFEQYQRLYPLLKDEMHMLRGGSGQ